MQNQHEEKDFLKESSKKIEKKKFSVISSVYGTLIHRINLMNFLLDIQS